MIVKSAIIMVVTVNSAHRTMMIAAHTAIRLVILRIYKADIVVTRLFNRNMKRAKAKQYNHALQKITMLVNKRVISVNSDLVYQSSHVAMGLLMVMKRVTANQVRSDRTKVAARSVLS